MLAAVALVASIVIGPEVTMPATASVPAWANQTEIAALANGDFIVVTANHITSALKIDGISGKPAPSITPINDRYVAITLRANGNRALALWQIQDGFSWIVLDKDAQPVARGSMSGASFYLYNFAYDIAPMGDGYLLVWKESQRVAGLFINADGAQRGPVFTVIPGLRSQLTLAAAGTHALLVSTGFNDSIGTAIISASGQVTPGGVMPVTGTYVTAAWDGIGFVLAWMYPYPDSTLWLGWTDADGHPIGVAAQYAAARSLPRLVGSSSGATMFFQQPDWKNFVARLGRGGAVIDHVPQPLSVTTEPRFPPEVDAAFNGRTWAVVSRNGWLLGALTDLATPASATPLAFTAPEQGTPILAAGDHQAFVGWSENAKSFVAPFRDGTFRESTAAESMMAMVADGDRAALLYGSGTADGGYSQANATFIDQDGHVDGKLPLGIVPPGKAILTSPGGARLADGSLLAGIVVRDGDSYESWHAIFGRNGVSRFEPFVPGVSLAIDRTAVAWTDDRDRAWVARYDPVAKRLGTPIQVADTVGPDLAVASDGAGHALVIVKPQFSVNDSVALVDLTAGKVVHSEKTAAQYSPSVAWIGSEYLLASESLDLIEIAADGTVGAPVHIPMPYDLIFTPLIAHSAAGTFVLYARPAVDLGLGDVTRIFARMIATPHHRAAGR